jgi:7-keto-8-aminopelargonate synthetase-like enzyme
MSDSLTAKRQEGESSIMFVSTKDSSRFIKMFPFCGNIMPIGVGDVDCLDRLVSRMNDVYGYLVKGIKSPTVPKGGEMIRISVCLFHDKNALSNFVDDFLSSVKIELC